MLSVFCRMLPVLLVEIFICMKEKEQHKWMEHLFVLAFKYVFYNMALLKAIAWVNHSNSDLIHYMNHSVSFALKYAVLLMGVSVIGGVITFAQRKLWKCSYDFTRVFESRGFHIGLILFATFILVVQIPRLNNISFWADERFTIHLVQNNIKDIIIGTANDVHPPLYYLIVHALCEVIGYDTLAYHLASFVPMVLYMVMILTIGWKRFGGVYTAFMVVLGGTLRAPLHYDMEARMYSWGLFFVAASFLALYGVIKEQRKRDYAFFCIATLCAAYTHYYCLLNIAIMYLVLIIMAVMKKLNWKRVLITSASAILGYLPWMVVFLQSYARTTGGDYWIKVIMTWKECNKLLFSGSLQSILVPLMIIYGAYGIWRGIVTYNRRFSVYLLTGYLVIYGTIGLALGISYLVRPVIFDRYLVPLGAVAWTILALGIKESKHRFELTTVLLIVLVWFGIAELQSAIRVSDTLNKEGSTFLNFIRTEMNEDSYLLNAAYYGQDDYLKDMPMVPVEVEDLETYSFEYGKTYFITVYKYEVEDLAEALSVQGKSASVILPSCSLGDGSFALYKLDD